MSITVDTNLDHNTRAKSVQKLVLKTRRNEQSLERKIISVYPMFFNAQKNTLVMKILPNSQVVYLKKVVMA